MRFTTILTALFTLALSGAALAAPVEDMEGQGMSPNEAHVLVKRYSCCSGGLAVNCGNCSVNGSGLVCCGNCCKKYPPGNGPCNPGQAKVVPNPTC